MMSTVKLHFTVQLELKSWILYIAFSATNLMWMHMMIGMIPHCTLLQELET